MRKYHKPAIPKYFMNSIVNSVVEVLSKVDLQATTSRYCQLHGEELVSKQRYPYNWYPEVSGLHAGHEASMRDEENCIIVV